MISPRSSVLGLRSAGVSLIKWAPAAGIAAWWLYDLQVHWRSLVDHHYGWIVVLLVGFLVSERWPTRPMDERPASAWTVIALALAGTPFVLIAELYKQAVAHTPASSFCLSIGCTLFITAFIVHLRGWSTWRHFAFPLLFLFVAVPIPKLLWNPVVLGLQSLIATLNVETLNLVGIPAQQSGNVIRLPRCLVGVDEACSGVRSLQSSIMVSLFVGDLVLRRWSARPRTRPVRPQEKCRRRWAPLRQNPQNCPRDAQQGHAVRSELGCPLVTSQKSRVSCQALIRTVGDTTDDSFGAALFVRPSIVLPSRI